jgi:hypothetical protein
MSLEPSNKTQKESIDSVPSHFLLSIHQGFTPDSLFCNVVNDLVAFHVCDRATIAVAKKSRYKVAAVSSLAKPVKSSYLVKLLERSCGALLAIGHEERTVCRIDRESLDHPESVLKYLVECNASKVRYIPIHDSQNRDDIAPSDRSTGIRSPIAFLILEFFESDNSSKSIEEETPLQPFLPPLSQHVIQLIENAVKLDSIPLISKQLRLHGTLNEMFAPKWKPWRIAASVGFLLLFAIAWIPVTHRVSAYGKLDSRVRAELFAPRDAVVDKVFVFDGQQVSKGMELLKLRNKDLEAEYSSINAEIDERRELGRSLANRLHESNRTGANDESLKLEGELGASEAELKGLIRRQKILESRLQDLTLVAPIDGTVSAFEIETRMLKRPINRGTLLLSIFQPSSGWQAVLTVPENRTGHVTAAWKASESNTLPVELRLASLVHRSFKGELQAIGGHSDISEENGVVVEAKAVFLDQVPPEAKYGAQVYAKIFCEKQPLWYVMFEDVVDFMYRYIVP